MKIVLDTNIFIGFNNVNLLEKMLVEFLKDNTFEFIIPESVSKECSRDILRKIENHVKIVPVDKEFVKPVKDKFIKSYKYLHTNKDADYEIVALTIKEKPDYLITNDRDIIYGMDRLCAMEKSYAINTTRITMAGLIRLMYQYKKALFAGNVDIANKNFLFYRDVELPNCYDGIKTREWDVSMVQKVVDPYKDNIVSIVKE